MQSTLQYRVVLVGERRVPFDDIIDACDKRLEPHQRRKRRADTVTHPLELTTVSMPDAQEGYNVATVELTWHSVQWYRTGNADDMASAVPEQLNAARVVLFVHDIGKRDEFRALYKWKVIMDTLNDASPRKRYTPVLVTLEGEGHAQAISDAELLRFDAVESVRLRTSFAPEDVDKLLHVVTRAAVKFYNSLGGVKLLGNVPCTLGCTVREPHRHARYSSELCGTEDRVFLDSQTPVASMGRGSLHPGTMRIAVPTQGTPVAPSPVALPPTAPRTRAPTTASNAGKAPMDERTGLVRSPTDSGPSRVSFRYPLDWLTSLFSSD